MNAEITLEWIKREMMIAIVRGVSPADIIDTAKALLQGGISNMEITFHHTSTSGINETLRSICAMKDYFGDQINIGAGTVLSVREVELASEAGADYMISPNTDLKVITRTKELGKVSIPGALTPTEICTAYDNGADMIKLFPAGVLGLPYINAVRAPLKHIPVCAVGGIQPETMSSYLKAGIGCFGIGGNLVSLEYIRKGEFVELTRTAKLYRQVLDSEISQDRQRERS